MDQTTPFDRAMAFVLQWEGGESNDPRDPGGLTKFGISAAAHPEVESPLFNLEDAKRIYRERYWDKLHLDELPDPMSLVLFDTAVNLGPPRAALFLQKAINTMCDLAAPLAEDGNLGPVTLKAAKEDYWPWTVFIAVTICAIRLEFYAGLARGAKSRYAPFLAGWVRRVAALEREIFG